MKVKSEREIAQSCPTLHDPMDFSLPGSSIHGIFQARVLEWWETQENAINPIQEMAGYRINKGKRCCQNSFPSSHFYDWDGSHPFKTLVAGVPDLLDPMPDDLRRNWRNNNRNKVHNKCNVFESFWNQPSYPLSMGKKMVFHETVPCCPKGCRLLPYGVQEEEMLWQGDNKLALDMLGGRRWWDMN